MAFTTAQLQALDAAIARGVLSVRYPDGSQTQYRTLAEMLQLRDAMRKELGLISKRSETTFVEFRKGYGA